MNRGKPAPIGRQARVASSVLTANLLGGMSRALLAIESAVSFKAWPVCALTCFRITLSEQRCQSMQSSLQGNMSEPDPAPFENLQDVSRIS